MRIVYTQHLKTRIKARNIPYELPRKTVKSAQERYKNKETGHTIAIKEARYAGKKRLMLVAYDKISEDRIEIVTIHPVERNAIESRVRNERFKRI